MNGITNSKVENYFHSLIPPRDDVLKEMEQRAERERIQIVGPAVGQFFGQLARIGRASCRERVYVLV